MSHKITFFGGTPIPFNSSAQATPAAPAPLMTTRASLISRSVRCRALIKPAAAMIAVPCWSSWNTGISIASLSRCSIIKHSGARISSRFIPPQVFPRWRTQFTNSSTSSVSISRSMLSMSANLLNKTALPSITGLAPSGPKFPRPRTAVPFEITATMFPFEV